MSQHKAKGGKATNPLHKPWTKTDKDAAGKANRNKAGVKLQKARPVKVVQDDEGKVYGENACRVLFS